MDCVAGMGSSSKYKAVDKTFCVPTMGALSHGARTVRARCVHGARTVQCFWDGCPTCTPLNGPHRNTPRVLISAPCSPYWHTRILQFLV